MAQRRNPHSREMGRCVGRACILLFDRSLLDNEIAVETAIGTLECHLLDPGINTEELFSTLASMPQLIEYALSAITDRVFDAFCQTVLGAFPSTPQDYLSSLSYRLLERFSLSFIFLLDLDVAASHRPTLQQRRNTVVQAANALRILSTVTFPSDESIPTRSRTNPSTRKKLASRSLRNQASRLNASMTDSTPFSALGLDAPTSPEDAVEIGAKILGDQAEILKFYLNLLRDASFTTLFKNAYIRGAETRHPALDGNSRPAPRQPSHDENSLVIPPEVDLPRLQSVKAALYFHNADGFGEWRISLSTRAERDLRQMRKRDSSTFNITVEKLKALSSGDFSPDNQKKLTGLGVEVPIYEAKMTRDTRLVYQVDCICEYESNLERQVLKVWGVYTHAQLDRRGLWDCVSRGSGWRGPEHRKRCNFRNRPVGPGNKFILPASWPLSIEPDAPTSPIKQPDNIPKEDLAELDELLGLEKFVTLSQALLNSILSDQDVAYVFDVSSEEKKIIEHLSSCYVLGRSGTGKTTTMLFKMFGMQRTWEECHEALPKPRQLFVTQSQVLAAKVEEYFGKLMVSLEVARQNPAELLRSVDAKTLQKTQGLVDHDEEVFRRGDLPKRFGELKDKHFPMFLTYDHLCRLLECEFLHRRDQAQMTTPSRQALCRVLGPQDFQTTDGASSGNYSQQARPSFVSYEVFREAYWSHFPEKWTLGLDPALVFAEFVGIIKGSEPSLPPYCRTGYMDKDTYCKLSTRTQPTFATERERIYDLFRMYLKKMKSRGDYDAADRTHALIACLRDVGVPGQGVDFMYVDEAQDNLLIDASVLRTLCRNPHGMFWAGDTAQTISAGSAFRFKDLKAFMYRVEEDTAVGKPGGRTQPKAFSLAVNYRSHAGIVDCARSVIDLITISWPYAIDRLAAEKGVRDGPKPLFFSGWDENTARYEQFLFGESGNAVDFGADQCILVRSEATRERLREEVGDIGLIMTLYDAKGLEFNDVLLYDFFEDSDVDWRVVLNAIPECDRGSIRPPRFDDPARYKSVCLELKFLYVAITRAKKNLWIADCSGRGEPMRIFWSAKGQIQTYSPGAQIPQLAASSTAEEWENTARTLFNNRRFSQAMHCFGRAGMSREKAVAEAYHLRQVARISASAREQPRRHHPASQLAFRLAARAFLTSAHEASLPLEKRSYYLNAAECFSGIGDNHEAAQAYYDANAYEEAAQHYRRAGEFENAVQVVKTHQTDIPPTVTDMIIDVSRAYFIREHQIRKARALFASDEAALEYMGDLGLGNARAALFEEMGNYSAAAEEYFAERNVLEAVRILLGRDNPRSMENAARYVLSGLWSCLSCGVVVTEDFLDGHSALQQLLMFARTIVGTQGIDEGLTDEVAMFLAIVEGDKPAELNILSTRFLSRQNVAAAFLCLDHIFSTPFHWENVSPSGIVTRLSAFLTYSRLLQSFAGIYRPSEDALVRKLFDLRPATEDTLILPPHSYLSTRHSIQLARISRRGERGFSVGRVELDHVLRGDLRWRLLDRVNSENTASREFSAMRACLQFAIYSTCTNERCTKCHEEQQYRPTTQAYNLRIRTVLLQILIYHTLFTVETFENLMTQRRYLLRQLHDVLFPPHPHLGTLHALSPESIPELNQGLKVARLWAEYELDRTRPERAGPRFLTRFAQLARFLKTFNPRDTIEYLRRIRCVSSVDLDTIPKLRRGKDPHYSYVIQDLVSVMDIGGSQVALDQGFLLVHHIIEQRVSIDINTLCDLLDWITSCLLVAMRTRAMTEGVSNHILHGITLPHSWILRLIPDIRNLSGRSVRLSHLYPNDLNTLLECIYTGVQAEHLLWEGRPLASAGNHVKNIFLERILKNICLWGYNGAVSLKYDIIKIVTSLRKPDRRFGSSVTSYVYAESWDALSRAVRRSSSVSSPDEMIMMYHGRRNPAYSSPANVRLVEYQQLEDIPRLLSQPGLSIFALRPLIEGTSEVPALPTFSMKDNLVPIQSSDIAEEHVQEDNPGAATEDHADDEQLKEETGNIEEVASAIITEQAQRRVRVPTAEELTAAHTIARAYKRYITRTQAQQKKPMDPARERVFSAFRAQAHKIVWSRRSYRPIFLGLAPHAFLVAELYKNRIYEAKDSAKKKLRTVEHLELEKALTFLNEKTALFKAALRLHEGLAPTSDIHEAQDRAKLTAYIDELADLVDRLPPAETKKWMGDLRIAKEGIAEPTQGAAKPARVPKPELNMGSELDLLDV